MLKVTHVDSKLHLSDKFHVSVILPLPIGVLTLSNSSCLSYVQFLKERNLLISTQFLFTNIPS